MIRTTEETLDRTTVQVLHHPQTERPYHVRLRVAEPPNFVVTPFGVFVSSDGSVDIHMTDAGCEHLARHLSHCRGMVRTEATTNLAAPLLGRVTAETCRPTLLTPPLELVEAGAVSREGMAVS